MKLSIAIPDSCLSDENTNLGKTRKTSIFARACAIFEVETIFVYRDSGTEEDSKLLLTILKYLDTPQYLRRSVFSKVNELKYAGVLHPLKIPSHNVSSDPKKISASSIREGAVTSHKGKKFLDVGITTLIPYFGKENIGKRITVQFKKGFPDLEIKEISKKSIAKYWGYDVKEKGTLFNTLSTWDEQIVLTSRKGKIFSKGQIKQILNSKQTLVVFGSPERGIHQILQGKLDSLQNVKILNFFPKQATETIRLEEAVLGTLSILNICKAGYI